MVKKLCLLFLMLTLALSACGTLNVTVENTPRLFPSGRMPPQPMLSQRIRSRPSSSQELPNLCGTSL